MDFSPTESTGYTGNIQANDFSERGRLRQKITPQKC
jgi:hypothetical protein